MPDAKTQTSTAPFAKGSIIWEKKGPLPVWAWVLIVLAVLLGVAWWRRNKAAGQATTAQKGYGYDLDGTTDTGLSNTGAGPIFIVPTGVTPPATPNDMPRRRRPHPWPSTGHDTPPGGGRDDTPSTPPPTPTAPVRPASVTVPANTDLYSFSQSLEQQYGGSFDIIGWLRGMGVEPSWSSNVTQFGHDQSWAATYGKVPYLTSARQVTVR
jgi:hypothetical protein